MVTARRKPPLEGNQALAAWRRLQTRVFKNEAAFQAEVIKRAHAAGWLVWFHYRSFHSPKGWPDLAMSHPARRLFVVRELKMPGLVPTPEQVQCLSLLRAAGVDADTIYPADLEAFTAFLHGA